MNTKLNNATATESANVNATDPRVIAAKAVRSADAARDGKLVEALRVGTRSAFAAAHLIAAGYAESSAKVLASDWSIGARVASRIGETATLQAIDATAKAAGVGAYDAVKSALRLIESRAKDAGATAKEPATGAKARALIKDAHKEAQAAKAAKAPKPRAVRVVKAADAATPAADVASPAAEWAGIGAATLQLCQRAHAAVSACPEGDEALCRKLARALADAAELGDMIAKRHGKAK